MPNLPAHTRRWVYSIGLAAIPLLVFYGVLEKEAAPLWIAAIGAVLGNGLALANVNDPEPSDETEEAGE